MSLNLFAQDEVAPAPKKEEKKYTETEFKEAVKKEVAKKLLKVNSKNVVTFSMELLDKENVVSHREKQNAEKEKQLEINQKNFAAKVKDFEERQKKVLGCLDQNEKAVLDRVTKMVEVISGMRPAKAADVLSVQDSNISVKILSQLTPVKASKIFNVMDKEISARLQKEYMNMKK